MPQVRRGCVSELSPLEREKCTHNSTDCKICIGNKCNNRPEILTCLQCDSLSSNDCFRPKNLSKLMHTCKRYDDECFTWVKNERVIRGCLCEMVETIPNLINDCQNPKWCHRCSNESCCNKNAIENEYCYSCDSLMDQNCSANLSVSMQTLCPISIQPFGCYHSEDIDNGKKMVKRGCIVGIDSKFCEIIACQGCVGNNCNARSSLSRCITCDSIISPTCAHQPELTLPRMCRNYNDQCAVQVFQTRIGRGCIDKFFFCNDDYNCVVCSEPLCNKQLLSEEYCLACDSSKTSDCISISNHIQRYQQKCPYSIRPHGCYHYDRQFPRHVIRGCLANVSSDERALCRAGNDLCRACNGNNCNFREDLQRCFICTSANNELCLSDFERFRSTCKHYNDQCFTSIENGIVTRGCLREHGVDFASQCKRNEDFCVICSYDSCNKHQIMSESCIQCNASSKIDCTSSTPEELDEMSDKCNYSLRALGCYSKRISENDIERDCTSNIVDQTIRYDCMSNNGNCRRCDSMNCNRNRFSACYSCDNCPAFNDQMILLECPIYFDSCVIFVNKTGHTIRGCKSSFGWNEIVENVYFIDCINRECNNYTFPLNRLSCYQCNGDDSCQDSNQKGFEKTLKACQIFGRIERCYTYIGNDKKLRRGCLTDNYEMDKKCSTSEKQNCFICSTSGCNNQNQTSSPTLECFDCNATTECAWGQKDANVARCQKDVYFGQNESCFILMNNSTSDVSRGCSLDTDIECKKDRKCMTCNQTKCNDNNFEFQSCHQCQSKKCQTVDGYGRQCPGVYSYKRRGCFTLIEGDVVIYFHLNFLMFF